MLFLLVLVTAALVGAVRVRPIVDELVQLACAHLRARRRRVEGRADAAE